MSSVQEIEAALPALTEAELRRVAHQVDALYRERRGAAIYDDAHGLVTDADLIIAADAAFQAYDKEEAAAHDRPPR